MSNSESKPHCAEMREQVEKINEKVSTLIVAELGDKRNGVTGVTALIGLAICLGKTLALVAHVEEIEDDRLKELIDVLQDSAKGNYEGYAAQLLNEDKEESAPKTSTMESALWS